MAGDGGVDRRVSRPGRTGHVVGLRSVKEADYITWTQEGPTMGGTVRLTKPRLAQRGRVLLGQWPDDAYDALVTELEARIAATEDHGEKGRLRGILEGVVGAGREFTVDVLAKAITSGQSPLTRYVEPHMRCAADCSVGCPISSARARTRANSATPALYWPSPIRHNPG